MLGCLYDSSALVTHSRVALDVISLVPGTLLRVFLAARLMPLTEGAGSSLFRQATTPDK